jgi:hypothetical protein
MMDGTTPFDSDDDESLARIDASIQGALNRLIDGGRIADGHREKAAEFRARLEALKAKLGHDRDNSDRVPKPAKQQSHLDLLRWDFQRWLAEIDDEFKDRRGPAR